MEYPETFRIRPLTATDEAAWRTLWTGYLEYYESTLPEEIYQSTFQRLLSGDDKEFRCLIAELDGVPVGPVECLVAVEERLDVVLARRNVGE